MSEKVVLWNGDRKKHIKNEILSKGRWLSHHLHDILTCNIYQLTKPVRLMRNAIERT